MDWMAPSGRGGKTGWHFFACVGGECGCLLLLPCFLLLRFLEGGSEGCGRTQWGLQHGVDERPLVGGWWECKKVLLVVM